MSKRPKRPILEKDGETFGMRLRRMRRAKGLTQDQLGEMIGVSLRSICSYERDECEPPAQLFLHMAECLDVSLDDLMGKSPAKECKTSQLERRWIQRFLEIQKLPERKQKSVLDVLDMALNSKE